MLKNENNLRGWFYNGVDFLSIWSANTGGVLLLLMCFLLVSEIILRGLFNSPTIWIMETTIYLFAWFAFLSLPYVEREDHHIRIDLLISYLPEYTRNVWDIVSTLFTMLFVAVIIYFSFAIVSESYKTNELSDTLMQIPLWIPKISVLIGTTLLGLQLLSKCFLRLNRLRSTPSMKRSTSVFAGPSFTVTLFLVLVGIAVYLFNISAMFGFLGLLFLLLFGGVPVFVSLGLTGAIGIFMLFGGTTALFTIPHIAYQAFENFTLVCLPLFIFCGQILQSGAAGQEIFDFCSKLIGNLPAGLGISSILACGIFAAISISSVATAATIGIITLPVLEAHKYKKNFSCGLLAAGGTLGIMIPPSGSMIIYSSVTNESLGKLFIAGVIPGIMLIVMFSVYAMFYCERSGEYIREKWTPWKGKVISFRKSFWSLLTPVIILGGIYGGIFTPLEAGAVALFYSILMVIIRRKIKMRDLFFHLRKSVSTTGMILIIIVGALIMGNFATLLQIPQKVIALVQAANLPVWSVVVVIMVAYLIIGMFLEIISAMLITLPVVYPLIISLGVDGIHFGVLVTLNMEIALISPPVGMNLYVITGIGRISFGNLVKGVSPFVLIMLIGLIILGLIPQLSTFLPSVLVG